MKSKLIKILKFSLCFVLFIPCVFIFTACDNNNVDTDSLRGKSAYEIAVEYGFQGTVEEWLESLKGEDGRDGTNGLDGQEAEKIDSYDMYLSAKNNNTFDGEYLDFLKTLTNSSLDSSSAIVSKCIFSVLKIEAYSSAVSSKQSAGSGVIYKYNDDGSAYILTNYHVTMNSRGAIYPLYKLYLHESSTPITASFVGGSQSYDVAVLKVEDASALKSANASTITFGTYSLGNVCYSIGDTSELGISVTRGIVSRESEFVDATVGSKTVTLRALRHDCYIYHGNSGGGLFNENGELIGLTNGGIEGTLINYAIPASIVKSIAENVIENTDNGYSSGIILNLGIKTASTNSITYYDTETSSVVITETVIISQISTDSFAYEYNALHENDENIFKTDALIDSIEIQGKEYKITRDFDLSEILLNARVGDLISINLTYNDLNYSISFIFDTAYATTLN